MSDAARQNLKVSREGIVLIKSFEGFRPRAIQREEGGWVIGYGHTVSAREGATVSEADAELLLRYDLLPVEKSVNETVPAALNQHQFDALVSFAFSVGVDEFVASDVCRRLNAGSPGEAADAMMGWPEPALPETALRRRAAERALFVANPGAPVALSDLLSAPLPPPGVGQPLEATADKPAVEIAFQPVAETSAAHAEPMDVRGAAVAALLGEAPARLVQGETSLADAETIAPGTVEAPSPSNDNPPAEAPAFEEAALAPEEGVTAKADQPSPEADDEAVVAETTPADEATDDSAPEVVAEDALPPAPPAPVEGSAWAAARYAPYNSVMVGPLPYLRPATPVEEPIQPDPVSIAHAVAEVALPEPEAAPPPEVEPAPSEGAAFETETAPVFAEAAPTEVETWVEPLRIERPPYFAAQVDAAPIAELVLTPLEDAPEPAFERPLWTPEPRDEPDGSENNLFGEDLTLTGGGSILRHEIEFEAPAKFDWSETGPFIFMGGVGLVSFGASMAAFRRAAEQSGGGDLTIIGWVLALIGLACVGVSSVNLYRKFGLPGGD
ncbi:glycoside hydrolase family protein [Brevundimonas sp. NIBR11]|uniref:glycoside hydrolase family protein n=1 Tax=Brevundimonas sp. NIBR11 TaxID=3015999 RepID=UPI0022F07A9E|nr:glycoside hydrolase family protein [Brevundimonas sp. NIBR11]WGM30631.1 hypothetical protein KKHFBJBL_00857 [Brevundimonas sp. NIBR11]